MDSFTSRVNFCLLLSSLGIHFFRDCHFLLNLTSTVFTIHKVCCVSLFQFLPWQCPACRSCPRHSTHLKHCDAIGSYTLYWWSMQVHRNVNITPSTPPPTLTWRSINFMMQVHRNVNITHPPHTQPWHDVASTSWCKCTWTLTSPHPPHTQPRRDVASTSWCKCTWTLTSPHPPHPQPWRDVASTSWCKCTWTLTSPHPPHPQPCRDVASTSWCKCTWTLTSPSPHPPHTQPWRDVAST